MDMKRANNQDCESQVILLDRSGQPLASVGASFSPGRRCGGFRLPSSADVSHVLASVTTAQMPGSHGFRLFRVRQCQAFHPVHPEQAHLEFHYEPLG
jgi:hypothetical protein